MDPSMSSPPPPPGPAPTDRIDDVRTGLSVQAFKQAFLDNLAYVQGRFPRVASRHDHYMALAFTVRDRLLRHWLDSSQAYLEQRARTVCYFSAEYLPGPHLQNNLISLGVEEAVHQAMSELGLDLADLIEQEEEPGLGNGGLGRLAACFMDSLATLRVPAIGYGIHYEYGIFDQEIRDGWQVEVADKWLQPGNPWELPRPEIAYSINLGGHTETSRDQRGRLQVRWVPDWTIKGVAHDTPILGYGAAAANFLRLWKAEANVAFDLSAFNTGDYYGAVEQKVSSENVTKVLYPNDEGLAGKRLRLEQQYLLVSCALQDMIRLYLQAFPTLTGFAEKFAAQLNDTHPSLAIAELMRLLVDVHHFDWEPAWAITRATFGYTNHTLLPEALERWPLPLFARVLPRHLEIIYEINARFLAEVRARYPGDEARAARLSIIEETGERHVRMAHLACVGSRHVNGVAKLHTELLRTELLRDFHELEPAMFSNKTNGVTPRRFLRLCNPGLAALISGAIGDRWVADLEQLRRLEPLAEDAAFRAAWRTVKRGNKVALARELERRAGVVVSPDSLYDVQVKRVHEYKRQHLNMLHVVTLYHRLKRQPGAGIPPRTVIVGGKAAPGYRAAKLIIKLVNAVAEVVNADPEVNGRLRVAFFPDFNVKSSGLVFPAADLSEQISLAGKEASGTGNMKLALNGALTIGTLDGANVEIREEVGADNFFLFGLTTAQVAATRAAGYRPRDFYQASAELREALDALASGRFSRGDRGLFRPLVDALLAGDEYMLLADYADYVAAQDRAAALYTDQEQWTRKSILTVARMGRFSSDRAIREYCQEIWKVRPVMIDPA
jgi:starch phosphorylase